MALKVRASSPSSPAAVVEARALLSWDANARVVSVSSTSGLVSRRVNTSASRMASRTVNVVVAISQGVDSAGGAWKAPSGNPR